jgi:chemotaxis methyl-accepting protein methylase
MLYLRGIHDARQLARFDARSWSGRRRRIAIDLIDDIDQLGDRKAREALFERIVDARGAFKRTYRDRFAAFDALVLGCWRRVGLPTEGIRVLDAAVSDGSTALALIEAVAALSGGRYEFTATDLDGRYVTVWDEAAPERRVIVSEKGQTVQIVLPPFLFTHRESRYLFPVNRALRPMAERFAGRLLERWRAGAPGVRSRELLLLAPEFRRLVERDGRISFRSWDILEPWSGAKATCVRAMNVLNPGYFDDAQMKAVLANLLDAVEDGGLLAVGSNDDAGTRVDGIVCRRRGRQVEVLARSGRGFRAPDAMAHLVWDSGSSVDG